MELKPINQQETITFINTSTFQRPLKQKKPKVMTDPENIIPNGIFGVIKWEIRRQKFTAGLSLAILLLVIVLIILQAKLWHVGALTYMSMATWLMLTLYKLGMSIIEFLEIKNSLIRYRQDLKVGLTSTPPFISRMYINFHKKQVSHNWITFSILFYGGIATLLLWWLKDVHWWILDFKLWIANWLGKPTLIATLMAATLLIIVTIHVTFAIMRRKRIADMNMYFGQEMASQSQIEEIKSEKNKLYRRVFFLSVLITLVIPIIIRTILKIINRKR